MRDLIRPLWSGLPVLVLMLACMPASTFHLSMSLQGKVSFLLDRDQLQYDTTILRRSKESLDLDRHQFLEIEFPTSRQSDISVTETLDRTRAFTRELIKTPALTKLGKDLWLLFPDRKESGLARDKWGANLPFTLTSIEGALTDMAQQQATPKCLLCPSPGFNIPEWIDIEKVSNRYPTTPVVIVNGNLDRLRNGYYPSFFYPELTRVSKRFYSKFTQALYLAPIAVSGDRFGGWLVRSGPSAPWEVYVKSAPAGANKVELALISSTEKELRGDESWKLANAFYRQMTGKMF